MTPPSRIPVGRDFFSISDAPESKIGCYYSRIERMIEIAQWRRERFLVVLHTIIDGRKRKIRASQISNVKLSRSGELTFICAPMLFDTDIIVEGASILDDENYELLPLNWMFHPRLEMLAYDTLKLTFAITSQWFNLSPHQWNDSIWLELAGHKIHMTRQT